MMTRRLTLCTFLGLFMAIGARSNLVLKSSEAYPCTKDLADANDYSKNKFGACSITFSTAAWLLPGYSPDEVMYIPMLHERCNCKEWKIDDCKKACDNDANCKGFVEIAHEGHSFGCEYATVNGASTCKSSGCSYVRSGGLEVGEEVTEVGDLDDGHRKHVPYCGCWRKKSLIKAP